MNMETMYTMRPAQPDDFTSPSRVLHLLERRNWAIVSAERQDNPPEINTACTISLGNVADYHGVKMLLARGAYGGVQETSLVLIGISTLDALHLARLYRQESILTRHGLVYTDGRPTARAVGIETFATAPEGDFTHILGTDVFFRVELEF